MPIKSRPNLYQGWKNPTHPGCLGFMGFYGFLWVLWFFNGFWVFHLKKKYWNFFGNFLI